MGSVEQQKSELAAFFGNALHESDEFKAGREYLMCADTVTIGGEVYCRPCNVGSFDWDAMKCPDGASLASENRTFNSYCQSNLLPPEGCECDNVYERASSGPMAGYVKADEVYFGRGSIQLSWNYNYIRASIAITGAPETFCQRPDLVATNEEYAWGAGLFYWNENIKNDRTCHQSILLNDDFGQTLDNINGGLECPADDAGWHATAIQKRLNRYCRSASAIGVKQLSSLSGCMDMNKRMAHCLEDGTCKDCKVWEPSLNLGVEGGDASSSVGGGRGGGRTKAGKQTKGEVNSSKQDYNADTSETSSSSSSSSSGKGKQEHDDPAMHHHGATSSTTSSSYGEQDSSSTSNVGTVKTEGEAPTISSSSGGKPPTELQIGAFPTTVDSSVESDREPSSSNGHHPSIRTRRPTPMPIGSEKQQDQSSIDASQFGVAPIMPSPTISSNVVAGSRPVVNPLSSPSFASQFATATTATHSKQNDDYDAAQALEQGISPETTNYLPEPSFPVQDADGIPPSLNSLPLGGMTNWANTKLVTTPSSTPTKSPIEVINIADAFHKDDESNNTTAVVDASGIEGDYVLSEFENLVTADLMSISGRVWHEKNGNGFEDANEPGLRGILVDLYRCGDDEWIEGTRTAAGGEYIFSDLKEGEYYYVVVTASSGYEFTIKNAGSDDESNNSDVNPTTGRGDCIQPSSSSSVNAGILKVVESTNPTEHSSSTEDSSVIPEVDYNCRGDPCAEGAGYCRSKHNFCGTGKEYCNDESQWTSECGTPSPTPQPSLTPTTAQPTIKYDPDVNCAGERCEEGDGSWCRSLVGFCGSGTLYCSTDSIWVPSCDGAKKKNDSTTIATPTTLYRDPTTTPSISPSEDPPGLRFSPFALPTLSQIVTPMKRTDARVETKKRVSSAARDEGDVSSSAELDAPESTMHTAEPWYESFSNVTPKSHNAGFRRTITDRVYSLCLTIIMLHLFR